MTPFPLWVIKILIEGALVMTAIGLVWLLGLLFRDIRNRTLW